MCYAEVVDFLYTIFSTNGFEPHSIHFGNNPELIWLIVLANALIVLAYFLIPVTLIYIVRKRKDLVFNWIFLLFGLFIAFCGLGTHLMHIVIFWYPLYWLQGIIEAITVVASAGTFFALLLVLPKIYKLTTPNQLQDANTKLVNEIEDHKRVKEQMIQKNLELEKINQEIPSSIQELERMNKIMEGREAKIMELKSEIEKLNKVNA